MRVKKFKKFQRHISFYVKNFSFKPPYHILVDGTFAKAALDNKVNMRDQLPKYLDGQVKLVTTPCVLIEIEKLGPELYGALQVLKQLAIQKCPHADKPIAATKCIKHMAKSVDPNGPSTSSTSRNSQDVENPKYIIGTQDNSLRSVLRKIPGTPLMYLYGSAPTLEKASDASKEFADNKELKKMEVLDYQKEILDHMKKDVLGDRDRPTTGPERKGTVKRKRAGPNPLSCKKSKKVKGSHPAGPSGPTSAVGEQVQAKKRKRIRIPKHVKAELGLAKPKPSQADS